MMSGWTDAAEELLVRLIHATPALYDATDKLYNHRAAKKVLWRQMEKRIGIPVADLRTRWDSLRAQYGRYLKYVESTGMPMTGRQAWVLHRLKFLEPHLRRKEANPPANPEEPSAPGSEAVTDGAARIKTEAPCSPPTDEGSMNEQERTQFAPVEESSLPEAEDTISTPLTEKEANPPVNPEEPSAPRSEAVSDGAACIKTERPSSPQCSETGCSSPTNEGSMKSFAPMEEASVSEAEDTITEEPSPCASADLSPPAKRRKTQLGESSSDDATNLLRIIGKTLETLVSRGCPDDDDDIAAFCRNLDRKMRKLPPHVLPHFQHEVDTCLYRYQILTSYNHTGQTSESQ